MRSPFSLALGGCWLLFAFAGCSARDRTAAAVSDEQWQQLCVGLCTKSSECSDAGSMSGCSDDCAEAGQAAETFATGCNQNQLVSDESACLEQACATYGSCIESAVAGAGCATGAGGERDAAASTSGDGGVSCALCDQAGICCSAVALLVGAADGGDAGNDCAQFTTAACNAAGARSGAFADNCELQLVVGQDYGVAACN